MYGTYYILQSLFFFFGGDHLRAAIIGRKGKEIGKFHLLLLPRRDTFASPFSSCAAKEPIRPYSVTSLQRKEGRRPPPPPQKNPFCLSGVYRPTFYATFYSADFDFMVNVGKWALISLVNRLFYIKELKNPFFELCPTTLMW